MPAAHHRQELARLTSLRAFAALAVFACHVGRWDLPGLQAITSGGYAAVSFFFVLSGFVLVWSTSASVTASDFYRRRIARIYPAHLVTLLVALLAPVVAGGLSVPAVVLGVVLLQAWSPASSVVFGGNDVSWSLSCEAFFYVLFPLVARRMRQVSRQTLRRWALGSYAFAAIVVIIGVAASQLTGSSALDNLVYTNPLIRLPEFLLGMAAAVAFVDGWRPRITMRAATIALLGTATLMAAVHAPGPLLDVVAPPIFLAIVAGAATSDIQATPGWLAHPWLVYAGQVSFCFYLVHELVIVNLRAVWSGPVGALAALVASAVSAVALHHLVERPCQRWLRRRSAASVPAHGTPSPDTADGLDWRSVPRSLA